MVEHRSCWVEEMPCLTRTECGKGAGASSKSVFFYAASKEIPEDHPSRAERVRAGRHLRERQLRLVKI